MLSESRQELQFWEGSEPFESSKGAGASDRMGDAAGDCLIWGSTDDTRRRFKAGWQSEQSEQ